MDSIISELCYEGAVLQRNCRKMTIFSYKTRGHVYSSCVGNVMLHASETWPLTSPDFQRLQCNDRAMIRQICNVKPENVATVRSNELLAQLEIDDLDVILREKRLHWFGHIERSCGAIKTVYNMQKEGKCAPGRSRLTWKTQRETMRLRLILVIGMCGDQPCVQLASYLERSPLMWMMLLHLHINRNADYDDEIVIFL